MFLKNGILLVKEGPGLRKCQMELKCAVKTWVRSKSILRSYTLIHIVNRNVKI